MATTTPNYGWPVPTSTDLVKDGAVAIEALGDAIDATVFGLGSGALTLINTTTFSNVASVSLPTGTFSATYANYRIICDFVAASGIDTSLRVRASGTDLTTSTYLYGRIFVGATAGIPLGTDANLTATFINIGSTGSAAGVGGNFDLDIHAPMLARRTSVRGGGVGAALNLTGGIVDNTTAYDSLTIFGSSNLTGTIRAYGYQN